MNKPALNPDCGDKPRTRFFGTRKKTYIPDDIEAATSAIRTGMANGVSWDEETERKRRGDTAPNERPISPVHIEPEDNDLPSV